MGSNIDACTKAVRMQKWGSILRDCKSSGQSNAVYCAEHEISIKTFYYWQNKLRKEAASALAVGNTSRVQTESHAIVPVGISGMSSASITIHKSGFTVEIADGTSPVVIEAVLAALSKC